MAPPPLRYPDLAAAGELSRRARKARERLRACDLCPRRCGVDRTGGETGLCRTGERAVVASWMLHFGEEQPLVGTRGSGAVFFAGCNLGCAFCQNHDISQPPDAAEAGQEADPEELAGVMLELAREGAANINLVSPSHVVPQVLEALSVAAAHGLDLPLVYNSGGHDDSDTLALLDGVVDIYMPDVKVWDPATAQELLGAADYPERARAAVAKMHAQVGDLTLDGAGLARRGLLVRHLVLPEGLAGTEAWMCWLARTTGENTYVNLMDQYRPCHKGANHPALSRSATRQEFETARKAAEKCGIHRLDPGSAGLVERILNKPT